MENIKSKLPKKFQDIVKSISLEDDLIDNCKYLVILNEGYEFDEGQSFIASSIKEIIEMLGATEKVEQDQEQDQEQDREQMSPRFYESYLRGRAINFLNSQNKNYKDEKAIRETIEIYRRLDARKTK